VTAYLVGNESLALILTVFVACAIGLFSSMIFTWASNKSAVWNIGFAIFLVLAATVGLLLAVALLLRRVQY
jgi:hypothetical protein